MDIKRMHYLDLFRQKLMRFAGLIFLTEKGNSSISSEKSIRHILQRQIQNLTPAYFALVMATGIVSIAAHIYELHLLSHSLFTINKFAYLTLLILYLYRAIFFSANLVADYKDHGKNPGFLTFVAGTNVLASQYVIIDSNTEIASYLFYIGLIAWFILIYGFFIIITVRSEKPPLEKSISGVWLLAIVSTQSVSVLANLISSNLTLPVEWILFFSYMMYLIGCLMYIIVITLIVYRLSFFKLQAEEFGPPYWINMGSVAITTLAGSLLMLNQDKSLFIADNFTFIRGFTLTFWAFGTWWIPLIIFLGFWRHFLKKLPLSYHPQYWGMVFPLGMYTVCTYRLADAIQLQFIKIIPDYFIYLALSAWLLAFTAMLYDIVKSFIKKL